VKADYWRSIFPLKREVEKKKRGRKVRREPDSTSEIPVRGAKKKSDSQRGERKSVLGRRCRRRAPWRKGEFRKILNCNGIEMGIQGGGIRRGLLNSPPYKGGLGGKA